MEQAEAFNASEAQAEDGTRLQTSATRADRCASAVLFLQANHITPLCSV